MKQPLFSVGPPPPPHIHIHIIDLIEYHHPYIHSKIHSQTTSIRDLFPVKIRTTGPIHCWLVQQNNHKRLKRSWRIDRKVMERIQRAYCLISLVKTERRRREFKKMGKKDQNHAIGQKISRTTRERERKMTQIGQARFRFSF